jgi:hypothetical protein
MTLINTTKHKTIVHNEQHIEKKLCLQKLVTMATIETRNDTDPAINTITNAIKLINIFPSFSHLIP